MTEEISQTADLRSRGCWPHSGDDLAGGSVFPLDRENGRCVSWVAWQGYPAPQSGDFEDLGIIDRVVASGGVYPPQRNIGRMADTKNRSSSEHQHPTPDEPYHIPLLFPVLTEAVMRERLAELGTGRNSLRANEFYTGPRKRCLPSLDASGVESLRVRYLVGTDGGRSFCDMHFIGFPGKTLRVRAVVADVILGFSAGTPASFQRRLDGKSRVALPACRNRTVPVASAYPLEGKVDLMAEG